MREISATVGRRDWEGLQSRWVLPAARRLYLVGALLALFVGAVALLVALGFQLSTVGGVGKEVVPEVVSAPPRDIAATDLDSLFAGPQRLRAEATPVSLPLDAGQEVARLAADSVYGVLTFELIGGSSADLVTQDSGTVSDGSNAGTAQDVDGMVLRASPELVRRLVARSAAGGAPVPLPVLALRVVAKDRNGNRSAPANVTFRISEPAPVAQQPAGTEEVREDIAGPEALRGVADALAGIAAPRGTAEWFDARQRAMSEPAECGAAGDDAFSRQYQTAVRHVRAKLTASNLDAFYRGLCSAWHDAASAAQSAAQATNQRRDAAIARNLAAEARSAMHNTGARIGRDAALGVALSAVFFFMIVALFLAFMAIEGHSHAIREALQAIARRDTKELADA